MRQFLYSILVISMIALAGCGSKLQKTIVVPDIPAWDSSGRVADSVRGGAPHQLFIDKFSDARPSDVIVKRADETVVASGEVGTPIGTALDRAFRNRGFAISQTAPVVLSGEVRIWQSEIVKGFPTQKQSANAELFLEVLDPANKRIYSGTYKGSASREDPSLSPEDIRATLGTAMSEALSQVTSDKQLIDLLLSY